MSTVRPPQPLATERERRREAQILPPPPPWELRPNAVAVAAAAAAAAAANSAAPAPNFAPFGVRSAVPTKLDKEIGRFFSDAAAESSTL